MTTTPLQIGQHLVRAFEAGFELGAKPINASIVGAVLSRRIDDLEPRLTRNGYDIRSLVEQFDAKPAEIRRLLRGDLDPRRAQELMDECAPPGCRRESQRACAELADLASVSMIVRPISDSVR